MHSETVFVRAHFQQRYVERTVKVPTGRQTKNLLGFTKDEMKKERRVEPAGYSDCAIDGEKLSRDLTKMISDKLRDGYRVLTIAPVTSGSWSYQTGELRGGGGSVHNGHGSIDPIRGNCGYSYGYSYTEGMLVTFVKE